jgi:hypothetical protein
MWYIIYIHIPNAKEDALNILLNEKNHVTKHIYDPSLYSQAHIGKISKGF